MEMEVTIEMETEIDKFVENAWQRDKKICRLKDIATKSR